MASTEPIRDDGTRIVDLCVRGALLGMLSGLSAAVLDIASTILWLSSTREQLRLIVALASLAAGTGALLGGFIGFIFAVFSAKYRSFRTTITPIGLLLAGPVAYVSWQLFTGGRMHRVHGLWLVRPLTWIVLLSVTTAGATMLVVAVRYFQQKPLLQRWLFAAVMVGAALAFHAMDHRILPRLYEYLHAALGISTAIAFASTIATIAPNFNAFRARWSAAMWVVVALLALPFTLHALDRWENVRAEVFGVHAPYVRHLAVIIESVRSRSQRTDASTLRARRARLEQERLSSATADEQHLPSNLGAHIVLITIDAMRADQLGSIIAGSSLTPSLDQLASEGTVFTRAYSQAPHSSYSLCSFHTSEYLHETVPIGQPQPLSTLADALNASGYRTAALFTNGVFFTEGERLEPYHSHDLGFMRADHVDRRADAQTEAAMREIDEVVQRGEPSSILWVHYFDAHEPYGGQGSSPFEQYQDALHHIDAAVGRLVGYARAHLARDIVIAVTADHGEEFGEHGGVYHGSSVYEEQVRVPLLIVARGTAHHVVDQTVQLIDVAPTLLRLVAVAPPASMRGRDLRGAMVGIIQATQIDAFSAVNTRTMVVRWPLKLIADERYGVHELYDLSRDPHEHQNLASIRPEDRLAMQDELVAWIDRLGESAAGQAVFARGRFGDHSAVSELVEIARSSNIPERTRLEAIDTLASFHDRAVISPIASLLLDPVASVGDRAAEALGEVGDTRARQRLRDVIQSDDPTARTRAALALAQLRDPLSVPTLTEMLYSGDEPTRLLAVDGFGLLRARDGVEPLLDALADDHLRYEVVLSLGEIGLSETGTLLSALALNDREDDVRANAAAGLALTRDRTYIPLLTQLSMRGAPWIYAASGLGRIGAIGNEVGGWDARSHDGTGWIDCHDDLDGPVWRRIGTRVCVADHHAQFDVTTRSASRRRTMIIRARGNGGPLAVENGREIARIPIHGSWQEWRIELPDDSFAVGSNHIALNAPGRFEISHIVVVDAPSNQFSQR